MNRYRDWLEQAERDREKASLDFVHGYFEWCCFTARQAAQKAVKALGMKLGVDVWGHAVTNLLRLLGDRVRVPEEIIESAQLLDTYYIPTRYPNAFSIGKPADYYNRQMAGEAVHAGEKVLAFCTGVIHRPV